MARRVLLIENDSELASDIRGELEALALEVEIVAEGELGLQRAKAAVPALVVLAVELPKMNGFLVCKRLRKDERTKDIPIVILSSDATAEIFERHRSLPTHADAYLKKPTSAEEVGREVAAILGIEREEARGDEAALVLDEGEVELIDAAEPAVDPELEAEIDAFAESAFKGLRLGSSEPEDSSGGGEALEHIRQELDAARLRAEEAERERDRLERELSDARTKSARQTGGISSREFFDLREALNAKDKEILDVRIQLSAKDKELVKLRDENLRLERTKAEGAEHRLELERKVAQAEDEVTALRGAGARIAELEEEREELRAMALEARTQQGEARAAREELEAKLEEEREQAKRDLQKALREQRRAHAEEVKEARFQADQLRESALARLRAQLEAARAEASQSQASLSQASQRGGRAEGEESRAIATLTSERDTLRKKVLELTAELGEAKESLSSARSTDQELGGELFNLQQRLAVFETRARRDEALLERARRAVAIGLSLLEEQANDSDKKR